MPDDPIPELPEATRRALGALDDVSTSGAPSTDHLEEAIIAKLRARGLLRSTVPSPSAQRRSPLWGAIAAMLLLAVGISLGRASVPGPGPAPTHVLLLRGGARVGSEPASDSTTRVIYSEWARREGQTGAVVGGEELALRGTRFAQRVSGLDSMEVGLAGGGPDDADVVGYFLLRAASRAEALQIARRCPHLQFGGSVELREITAP